MYCGEANGEADVLERRGRLRFEISGGGGGKKLLIDCGIFQGSRELQERNFKPLPASPATIDYCVLTHAHLDHTGWLPCLTRDGYKNKIYANQATIELTTLSLKDSGICRRRRGTREAKGEEQQRGGYPAAVHERRCGADARPADADARSGGFDVSPEFQVESFDAGHILGSSSLRLTIREDGKNTTVVFSGDVGRYSQPILNDPVTPPGGDYVICESTYGDRSIRRAIRCNCWRIL